MKVDHSKSIIADTLLRLIVLIIIIVLKLKTNKKAIELTTVHHR